MELLFLIIIQPVEFIMRVLLNAAHQITSSWGWSIVLLSVLMNLLLTPLYILNEKWRSKENLAKEEMREIINNIKKIYSGKERYFYIRETYRAYNYKPVSTLKASAGLLIQIPLFFSVYHLLANYEPLIEQRFFFIKDLSKPDALLWGYNILPFLMAFVGLVAGYFYFSEGQKVKKIQFWTLNFLFLIFLYNSPSALLIYWTMNNLLSMLRGYIFHIKILPILYKLYFKKAKVQKKTHPSIGRRDESKRFIFDIFISSMVVTLVAIVASKILPVGVSLDLNSRSLKYLFSLSLIFFTLLFFSVFFRSNRIFEFSKRIEPLEKSDLALLLIPMTFSFQYIIINSNTLSDIDILFFLVKSIGLCSFFVILIPYVLSFLASKKILSAILTSYVGFLFYTPILSSSMNWSGSGSIKYQLIFLVLGALIIWLLYFKNKKILILVCICFFVCGVLLNSFLSPTKSNKQIQKQALNQVAISRIIEDKLPRYKNDIIFLIYESYVNQETMKYYGFDNQSHIEYLLKKGFSHYPNNYTLAADSTSSMSRTLDINTSVEQRRVNRYTAGKSFSTDILRKKIGYKTIGVVSTDYFYRGEPEITWDNYFPVMKAKPFDLFGAVLEGEFRFDFESSPFDLEDYIAQKRFYLKSKANSPYFMYTHNRHPGHTQNSGQCLEGERETYFENVKIANQEMIGDIEAIINNNPDAIVVIAGDHGPYHTKNCYLLNNHPVSDINRYDIQDRYGAFLAIRWPEKFNKDYPIKTNQDIMPAILANLYEEPLIWEQGRTLSQTLSDAAGKGVYVVDSIVNGGIHDGQPLFIGINNTKIGQIAENKN